MPFCFSSPVWEPLLCNSEPTAEGRAGDLSPCQGRLDLENLPTQQSLPSLAFIFEEAGA